MIIIRRVAKSGRCLSFPCGTSIVTLDDDVHLIVKNVFCSDFGGPIDDDNDVHSAHIIN